MGEAKRRAAQQGELLMAGPVDTAREKFTAALLRAMLAKLIGEVGRPPANVLLALDWGDGEETKIFLAGASYGEMMNFAEEVDRQARQGPSDEPAEDGSSEEPS